MTDLGQLQAASEFLFVLLILSIVVGIKLGDCNDPDCKTSHERHRKREAEQASIRRWERDHKYHDPMMPTKECPFCR